MRLAYLLVLTGVTSACLPPLEDADTPGSVIYLANTAPVTLSLNRGGQCDSRVDEGCLSESPRTVIDISVEKDSIVKLGGATAESNDLFVEVEGLKPGETKLAVTYENVFGDEYTDVLTIRVAEIDRVDLEILCLVHGEAGDVLPVASSSVVAFRHLTFDDNGNQLATGRLEVIEGFDGFTPDGPPQDDGDVRQATAPTSLGSRQWDATGPNSLPVDFLVYEAGIFDLELSEAPGDELQIARVVAGQQLCTHEGAARAVLSVTSGPCRPMIDGVEIVGAMPIDLTDEDVRLEVSGSGSCQFTATQPGAPPISATLDFDNPVPVPEPGTTTPLDTTPVESGGRLELHGECVTTKNLSNGKCEILDGAGVLLPDADCLFDIEWQANHYDGTHNEKLSGVDVGVGLATELRTKVSYELIGFIPLGSYPPNNLAIDLTPDMGLGIQSNGCNDFSAEVLALRPEAPADYAMVLSADNAFDTKNFTLRARTVEQLTIDFLDVPPQDLTNMGTGVQVAYFVGNSVSFDLGYAGATGRLYGTGPVLASASDPTAGATIGGFNVSTGVAANVVSLASAAAPQVHTIAVVDASAIESVEGLSAQQVSIGTQQCFQLGARGPGGSVIHGTAPVRPTLELIGDDALLFDVDTGAIPAKEVCLAGLSAGSVDLEATFGGAADAQTWTVLP